MTAEGGDLGLTAEGGDLEVTAEGGGAALPEADRRIREAIDGVEHLDLDAHPSALGEALSAVEEQLDALRRGIPGPATGPGAIGRPDRD